MKQKWDVERSHKQCAACKLEFAEGAPFFSALYPVKGGGFARRDFCPSCWPQFKDVPPPPPESAEGEDDAAPPPLEEMLSFWKTRIRPAQKKDTGPRFDPHVALSVFTQVQQRQEKTPDEIRLVFILALSLARRRMLKISGMQRGAGRSFLHLSARGGKEFRIEDPGLSEQDMLDLLGKIGELLEMNLDGDAGGENPDGAQEESGGAQEELTDDDEA